MSIAIEQLMSNKLEEAYVLDWAKPHEINLTDRIDFEVVYAIVGSVVIWGCFIWAFWSLI